jgi:glutaredoxin-like YruB-family protein
MTITVYSTPTCPYCKMAKAFLKEHDVAFKDVDVSADREEAAKMIKLSGQMAVPVIDVDGELIIGFDQKKLAKAVGIHS